MNCLCCWDCLAIDWWLMKTMQKSNPGDETVSAHKPGEPVHAEK